MYKILSIIIIIIIIVIIIILYYNKCKNKVTFLSKKESSLFLKKDNDNYIHDLNNVNLFARKVYSVDEYINKICNNTKDFCNKQKSRLIKCCEKADEFLSKFNYMGLNCKYIADINWKFAYTGNDYEEGLPHTRNDIIFLSHYIIGNDVDNNIITNESLISTLIHEKVHIFQRYNPEIMNILIKKMGYEIAHLNEINPELISLRRSNPDINQNIYKNKDGILLLFYNSNKPSGINDVYNKISINEHPYEIMAYEIASYYNKNIWKKLCNNNNI